MVSVLVRMKFAVLRHSMNGGRAVLVIMGGLFGLLLAIGTVLFFTLLILPYRRIFFTLPLQYGLSAG